MKNSGLNFGGEQSGHVIMHDFAKTGDGLISALQALALVITSGKKASEVLRPFTLYPQTLVNLRVKQKPPLESIDGLADVIKAVEAKGNRQLIRYSGTENKLRLLLECKDAKVLKESMQMLESFFEKALNAS